MLKRSTMKLKMFLLGALLMLLYPAMIVQAQQPTFHVTLHDAQGYATPNVPNSRITFSAVIKNNGPRAIYINGASLSLHAPNSYFTLDATKFYTNVPTVLAANSSWSGAVFDVISTGNAPLNQFFLGNLTVLGGSDEGAQNELDSVNFSVAVVPEGSSFALFGAGLLALGLVIRRRPGLLTRLR